MRQAEVNILTVLGWNPKGLIESANDSMHAMTGNNGCASPFFYVSRLIVVVQIWHVWCRP